MEDPKSILIVDDSRVARMMTAKVIKECYQGIDLLEADSGEACLELLEKNTPDLILMDINMGGIDGIETSRMILTASPEQKIIVCSANIQSGMQDKVNELGISFLAKPIMADKLKDFISKA